MHLPRLENAHFVILNQYSLNKRLECVELEKSWLWVILWSLFLKKPCCCCRVFVVDSRSEEGRFQAPGTGQYRCPNSQHFLNFGISGFFLLFLKTYLLATPTPPPSLFLLPGKNHRCLYKGRTQELLAFPFHAVTNWHQLITKISL